jgi:plasmid rolling circle replication initiator protein Rep
VRRIRFLAFIGIGALQMKQHNALLCYSNFRNLLKRKQHNVEISFTNNLAQAQWRRTIEKLFLGSRYADLFITYMGELRVLLATLCTRVAPTDTEVPQ